MNPTDKAIADLGGAFLILGSAVGVAAIARWIGIGVLGTAALWAIVFGLGLLAASGWGDEA